ncbi:FAD binding domain protein [Colletotrichum asianum]|uniref:FAD binding domain protein n=1 Tax=Colletotrichum asianum TaxID=702518 RepID=A0A8H3ZG24_9PEZI|nr:FAD binding domain protein [Colletotrichum asianum]
MSPSESKIHVAVVGAGIAGLAIAVALRRCPQYAVTVYERRAAHLQEPSAGFGIRDHGVTVLKKLGIHRKDVKGVMAAADGEVPLWLLVRQDLREALLRRLAVVGETLTPIEVVFDANVTTVEPEIGAIHWSLVGADGIHSRTRPIIVSDHPEPIPSGVSLFRFDLPMGTVKVAMAEDHEAQAILSDGPEGVFGSIFTAGNGDLRHVVVYPCRDFTQVNFAIGIPDSFVHNSGTLCHSWTADGSTDDLLRALQGFPHWLIEVVCHASFLKLFQVRDVKPLQSYFKGNTVVIGDAAHAMVPYQGQGANQALEDADGLCDLLADADDPSHISEILRLWDSVRRPRASAIQEQSRDSLLRITTKGTGQSILAVEPHVPIKEVLLQRAS